MRKMTLNLIVDLAAWVVMILPAATGLGGESPDGYSEYYVCPEGFGGQYRMLIKSAWGKPTAGKVTVEVATNFGSDKQSHFNKQVPLGERGAAVLFQLDNGRRNDPLDAQQIANVARAQSAK